jgi:glycosyltransferase involved in cell wall biosynthesis
MSSPLISVIIPCFNLGAYLREAVESVLDQTIQDVEILIVDDGSTDDATRSLVETLEYRQTTAFRTENQGLARARNFLIARARGTYLCALDADDRLDPRFFAETLGAFERDPSLSFVSTHLQMFGTEDRRWPDEPRCTFPMLLCDDTVITAALVRRDAVLSVGGYDERMPGQGDEDWDLWISLVEAGHRGLILPDVLFYYRRRQGSMCDQCTTSEAHLELLLYIVRKHLGSYRRHLLEVLLWKEERISAIRRANLKAEMELGAYLQPWVSARRAELAALKIKLHAARTGEGNADRTGRVADLERALADAHQERETLHAEYQRALEEVAALRRSASWRLTAPLRSLYDLARPAPGGDAS